MLIPFDNTYAHLPEAFYAKAQPTPVSDPMLIRLNHALAAELGIDADQLESAEGVAVLAGNLVPEGAEPVAMAYSGHQFGGFSPQLGDGRALLLGEVIHQDGARRDIQLKGSGPTPFSRRGDGRSALGPVLREYIVSEAMAALGVPTTRALAAVSTGENVRRETLTPGGVFTRVARSHVRVGTFQWFAARRDTPNLKLLADYVINRHYPQAAEQENPYLAFLKSVIQRQAALVAHWMQIGFVHGVMNTDNCSVIGETIDYGPCAFMDAFDPARKFSSIDHQGRYAFANQPPIAHWNLTRLAETLLPFFDEDEKQSIKIAEQALEAFPELHQQEMQRRFCAKIGVADGSEADWPLVESLLAAMTSGEADFTLVFRHLPDALQTGEDQPVLEQFNDPAAITAWLSGWRKRLEPEDRQTSLELMRTHNPVFIPRNHRIEAVIQAAYEGDFDPFHQLNEVLARPFEIQPQHGEFEAAPRPEEVVCATFCGT